MNEARQKICPRCGAAFPCSPPRCWCLDFPALSPLDADSDCLCPQCLAAATAPAPPPPPALPEDGFTLIELLVTIAAIAILAALLLPALGRGRNSARTAKCAGNLREFGVAAQMYWDDNDGVTFPYMGAATAAGTPYWFGLLGPGAEETRAFDPSTGPLYPYLGAAVNLCPSFDYGSPRFKYKAKGPVCDYGCNKYLSSPPLNLRRLSHLAGLALFADAAQVNTFEAPASPQNPLFEEFYYIDSEADQPNGQFRHNRRAGVVFCDGHAGLEQMVPGTLDARLPAEWIGALRPPILTPAK